MATNEKQKLNLEDLEGWITGEDVLFMAFSHSDNQRLIQLEQGSLAPRKKIQCK